jgi:hypothetical protein
MIRPRIMWKVRTVPVDKHKENSKYVNGISVLNNKYKTARI